MRIIATSDTHNEHASIKVPYGDIFIHCGDATSKGDARETKDFLEWMISLPHPHKIYVPGNHDLFFESKLHLIKRVIPDNLNVLIEDEVSIHGIKFYGSPITPRHGSNAFSRTRGHQMREYWKNIPLDTDVLLTHCPPYGILDTNMKGDNCGCEELTYKVKQVNPKYHLFGHIHDGYGMKEINGTKFHNVAYLNRKETKVRIIDFE